MAKQQIHIIVTTEGEAFTKSLDTQKELNETLNEVKKEHPAFDPVNDVMVIVGEKRCIKARPMRATIKYTLSNTGCGC